MVKKEARKQLFLEANDTLIIRNTTANVMRLETDKDYVEIPPTEAIVVVRETMWVSYSEHSRQLYKLLRMTFWQRLRWALSRKAVEVME